MSVPHSLLFVCEANVCRSPLMELALRDVLASDEWEISSRGTQVSPGMSTMCSIGALMCGVGVSAHTPVALTLEDIERSHLIITASRAERAAAAAMVPAVRWKVFTLREAIFLGERAPTAEERGIDGLEEVRGPRLEKYAAVLHRRRGLLDPPVRRRRLLPRRPRINPLDVPDVHSSRPAVHRAVLREVAAQVGLFGEQLATDRSGVS